MGGHGWSAGKLEGLVDRILGFLLDVLNEGELGQGEGSGDAGLVDEDDAEAGADDRFRGDEVGEADAGGYVAVMQRAGRL